MLDAARAVDYETIVLLFGMMVVVAYLRLSGVFALGDGPWIAARFSGPLLSWPPRSCSRACSRRSWSTTSSASRVTPLVLQLCRRRAATDPLPDRPGDGVEHRLGGHDHRQPAEHDHRLALAHPYLRFRAAWPPMALIGLLLNFIVVAIVYRKTLTSPDQHLKALPIECSAPIAAAFCSKSLAVTLVTIGLFFRVSRSRCGLGAAAVLMFDRVTPSGCTRRSTGRSW